jgi:outer membrane receptor protein involved in Fe transport
MLRRELVQTFACAALLSIPAFAQVITGTILGTVTDSSGAPVAATPVMLRNTGTNIVTRTITNNSGEYTVPLLPPGSYEVSIEVPGFKAFRQTNVNVGVDEKARIDVQLAVGDVTEVVEVTAAEVLLQTDSSDLGKAVSQQVIATLPNVGRNPLRFAPIVPGVTPRPGFNNLNNVPVGEDSRRQFSDFTINGGRAGGTEILLDGAPNTSGAFNEIAVLPNADAVGEFKIITNAYSAEFGRAGSGVVQLNTRSGGNEFHGAVYDYFRNSALNANSFGNNYFGIKRGVFNLHQFGGAISGPVTLPGYSGRNRTFFFASFEGIRFARDASGFLNVPTELERTGDFSQTRVLRSGALVPVDIYNPSAATSTLTATGNGVLREQFQDAGVLNKIPARYLNPVALRLLEAFPLPNRQSPAGDGTQNFFYSGSTKSTTQQIIAKVDHHINSAHRFTIRYSHDWSRETPPNPYADTIPQAWQGMPVTQYNPSAAIIHTWTKSPTSLFEFRANVTRINLVKVPEGGFNIDLAALGFSPEMVATARYFDYPRVTGANFSNIGHSSFDVRDNRSTNPSVNGSFTKVMNRLTMKFGGEYRIYLNNFSQPNIPSFAFTPNVNFTTRCSGAGCPPVPGNVAQGHSFAGFLTGAMDGAADTANGQYATGDFPIALSSKYLAFYTQSDWKVNSRLTINLGVRWDYGGSLKERYDRLSQFEFDRMNITGTPGRYTFPNFEGNGGGRKDDSYTDFAPRVGFAYRPFDKTVIRSAYGISFDPVTGTGSGILGFGADGFRALSFLRIRPNSGQFALLDVLDRPFNDAYAGGGTPLGPNPDDPGYLGYNAIAVQRREGGNPYMQQWNFTVERTLPADIDFQASYVGTKGTHLYVQFTEINGDNALNQDLLAEWRQRYIATSANPANVRVPNPFYVAPPGTPLIGSGNPNVAGSTITQLQLNRPYPAFTSVRLGYQRYGSSSYNALQLSARRPFRNGFELGGNYVWSKSIDTTTDNSAAAGNTGAASNGSFAIHNLKLDRTVSQFDVPHRAVIYSVIESPFGRGKPYLSAGVAGRILGNWKLSTMTQFQSGLAIGISGGGFGRPDLVGDPVLPENMRCVGPQTCGLSDGGSVFVPAGRMLYFNPNAFRNRVIQFGPQAGSNAGRYADDIYWYGTSPRLIPGLRGWGLNNTDLSLARTFAISERYNLVFRADAVNVFNRKSFSDAGLQKAFGATYLPANVNDPAQLARAGTSTNANFGTLDIRSVGISPRYLQFALRLTF